ncbi:hypothetical protein [Deinococcus gobiensis]|nr:hypothetical protein [Deinococcus gobiensis]
MFKPMIDVPHGGFTSHRRKPATSLEVLELLVNRAERAVIEHPHLTFAYRQMAETEQARDLLTELQKREVPIRWLIGRLEDAARLNHIARNPLGEVQGRLQCAVNRLEHEEDFVLRRDLLNIMIGSR